MRNFHQDLDSLRTREYLSGILPQVSSPALQIIIIVLLTIVVGLPAGMTTSLGEEIGWQGLFVPELAKVTTVTIMAVISGAVWGLWYLPLLFFAITTWQAHRSGTLD